jgi:hypothetical protein
MPYLELVQTNYFSTNLHQIEALSFSQSLAGLTEVVSLMNTKA